MRLIAGRPDAQNYSVLHVPTCTLLRGVVWVDDTSAEYCQFIQPPQILNEGLRAAVHRARKIVINTENKVVLIDPIEFSDPEVLAAVDFIQKSEWVGA